jgi:hypothetical protein
MSDSDEAEMARLRNKKRGFSNIEKPVKDDLYESS